MKDTHTPSHLRYMEEFCTRCVAACPIRVLIGELGSYRFVNLGNPNCRNTVSSCMSADAYFDRQKPTVDAVSKRSVQPTRESLGFRPP